jgi:hypothetical protein
LHPNETSPSVFAVLAILFFFIKVEPMRTKTRPGARNFAEVVFHGCCSGIAPLCRGTEAVLGEKKGRRFEAVTLLTDKYQVLNGTSPAFFSGTGTLQGC